MAKANIKQKFIIMNDRITGAPYLVCLQKTPQGDFGAFGAISENGKIKELNIMPSSFYHLECGGAVESFW
jgi:hypothetical protein